MLKYLGLCLLIVLPSVGRTEEANITKAANPVQPLPYYFDKLQSNSAEDQSLAALEAESQQKGIKFVLLHILKQEKTVETRSQIASAIRIAGILRIAETSEAIVSRINYLEYGEINTFHIGTVKSNYVAVGALIEIGIPAIKPTLTRLLKENDPYNRFLLVNVIQGIQGKEIAKFILENEIKNADEQGKANLQAALKLMEPVNGVIQIYPDGIPNEVPK